MSMHRTILRNRAKNMMADMGADKINRRMGYIREEDNHRINRPRMRKLLRTTGGRKLFRKELEEKPQMWKRILYGDLMKDARKATTKMSIRRGIASGKIEPGKV